MSVGRPDHEVVVVGAGFSGIGMGIRLKQAGIHDFVILERGPDIGGTWRDNTYPGVAVDIMSFTYSFSFEQNPGWSRVFAPGRELKAYADHCADKYGLRPHVRLSTTVRRASFDEDAHLWRVELDGGTEVSCRFLVSSGGGLTQPKAPDIEGIDTFAGPSVHTAQWDHDLDLRDKRVAVIGTGASAVQLVPEIAPTVAKLDVYQRTPIWIFPKPDVPLGAPLRATFRTVPQLQWMLRLYTAAITELVMVLGIMYNRQLPFLIRALERICKVHLRAQVRDPKVREKLTPSYGFGCKRPSFSNAYLRAFNRDDVELVTDPIERVSESAIHTRDGRAREIDVLVLATGFKVFEPGNVPPFEVRGRDGVDLGAWWDEHRFQAYEGATVPNCPNFFLVLGPYSVSGSSWFAMVEAQTRHAVRCIEAARRRGATYVAVRQEPHDRFFEDILRRQQDTIFFNNNCAQSNSYYFDHHGDAPFLRPASGVEMWWRSGHFPLDDYEFRVRDAAGERAVRA
jgi:cation diffusion facilitator CzcD-associated flavoprotein CzcO